jgi:Fic family protein
MVTKLSILPTELLEIYVQETHPDLEKWFDALKDADISTDSFSFYTSVSSVFSSKIEGEEIELDSYVKHKRFGLEFLPDYTEKIDDLYEAYLFAQTHELNQENIEKAHILLSRHLLPTRQQGKIRTQNVYVATDEGRIEYVAATPFEAIGEMEKFYEAIKLLVSEKLDFKQVFFFASLIHLVFVKIHPFSDGNGRTGRLLEKWFLMQKLGEKARFIPSERNYYQNHPLYYKNLRALGLEYPDLDYSKALPFLKMLASSLG